MKLSRSLLLAGFLPTVLHGGEVAPVITPASTATRWSFGISYAPLLNVKSDFSGLGGFNSPFTPQPLGPGQNRDYDDGYVRVDDSGNAMGYTSYWGYSNASQYDSSGSGTITQNITNSLANGRAGETEDISQGIELSARLDMGQAFQISGRPVTWGLKGGLHYASVDSENSGSLTSDALVVSDHYDLGGGFPPSAGHAGTPDGFGYLFLGDSPTRTTTLLPGGAVVQGSRSLDADLFTFGLGPYVSIPVMERLSLSAEAGVNLSIAHGEYAFDSATTIAGLGTRNTSGKNTRTVILPGIYAGVAATWDVSEIFAVQASARYQYLDQFSIGAGGSQASLSFDGAAVISLGGVWKF